MAILNLLDLQPTTISRDLRDKYILLYGPAKCGVCRHYIGELRGRNKF